MINPNYIKQIALMQTKINGKQPTSNSLKVSDVIAESAEKHLHVTNYRFLSILRTMVDDESNSDIIRWNNKDEDHGFTVLDTTRLEETLKKYFLRPNTNSFVRQLNLYGFHKKGKQLGTSTQFFNANFVKDDIE